MINDINRLFENISEKPTIIFDLKGILPRVTKISYGIQTLSLQKGDKIKFFCGNTMLNDHKLIHIDRNITNSIEIGDRIIIDSSGSILKVNKITYYSNKKRVLPKKKSSNNLNSLENINLNSAKKMTLNSIFNFNSNNMSNFSNYNNNQTKESIIASDSIYDQENSVENENISISSARDNYNYPYNNYNYNNYNHKNNIELIGDKSDISIVINDQKVSNMENDITLKSIKSEDNYNSNSMETIKENENSFSYTKESPLFDVDRNYWKTDESTLKNKQNKIEEVYRSLVKKHSQISSNNNINKNLLKRRKSSIFSFGNSEGK